MFAVVITTKSLSQVGEQMFSQRLVEVNKAQTALKIAEANNEGAIENDDNKLERIEALDAEIESFGKGLKEFGKPPEPKQVCNVTQGRRGYNKTCRMVPVPWAGATMQQQLVDTRNKRNAMDAEMVAVRQGARQRHSSNSQCARRVSGRRRGQPAALVRRHAVHEVISRSNRRPDRHDQAVLCSHRCLGGCRDSDRSGLLQLHPSSGAENQAAPAPKRTPTPVNIMPALRELANELKLGKATA